MFKTKKSQSKKFNISVDELVYPLFVKDGTGVKEAIVSMPGVFRFSPDTFIEEVSSLESLGIKRVLIFGIPSRKDWQGSWAYKKENIVSQAVRLVKTRFPDITIMTDVCLCAYTNHGHCGVIKKGRGQIDNRTTLENLSKMALAHAQAGADFVCPSAMAKNQVKAIRNSLDKNGYIKTKIMGYSAKFASNFYGPFRDIANSAPKFGDRSKYQLGYSESKQALSEIEQDIKEGADIVMVKPALSYLDIVKEAKGKFSRPLAVYNVSGEYSFVKLGAEKCFWKEREMVFEIISSIKRAGADFIITYHAKDIAKWLKERSDD